MTQKPAQGSADCRALLHDIPFCLTSDQHRLRSQIHRLQRGCSEEALCRLKEAIQASKEKRAVRLDLLPSYRLDESLPIAARQDEILAAIQNHPIVVICGETGSGKTTQLPLICLKAGRGISGMIGHTQPRRIAARAIAQRLSSEIKQPIGQSIGYQVRFKDKTSPNSHIKIMTDGILLAEIHTDPYLSRYDTIIIDEAHERSLNIDFLLGFLKNLVKKRKDLKVIITSATIDAARFSEFFNQAPVIEVSGRTYPVDIRYRPLNNGDADVDNENNKGSRQSKNETSALMDAISQAVDEAISEGEGDILVFLPGEREIREAAHHLKKHALSAHTRILPLYARQSSLEQQAVFERTNARKIVLSTNVAETSLTVPGIRFVIDSGLARVKRYSHRRKIEQLRVEGISQASANQRSGRCGRVSAGICFRLYDQTEFELRPAYTDPEIIRSSLASVILKMKLMRLGDVDEFDFIDKPWPKMVAEGYRLLSELGAMDELKRLTTLGRQMGSLPLDPKIARILLAANEFGCVNEMLIICSALSVQDPREFPLENREAAETAHRRFYNEQSECFAWLTLWRYVNDLILHKKSNKKLLAQCKKEFLSLIRIREWRDVHSQLTIIANENKWAINSEAAPVEGVIKALISGFLGYVGRKTEEGNYLGTHGLRFWIHPASSFRKKIPQWLVAAEITETTKLYARQISAILPEWIEDAARHLVSCQYLEPHWEQDQGKVVAFERISLYGLVIIERRPVHFGPIDPVLSREIFIRSALVEGQYQSSAPFWQHNQKLVNDIEQMEHRARRQDLLVDEETRYRFYDSKIPAGITQKATFEKWRKKAEQKEATILYFDKESLMRHDGRHATVDLYPAKVSYDGIDYKLTYWHEPGSFRDGVTLTLPLSHLNLISETHWPVPGFLKAKVLAVCKALAQRYRTGLIPLPSFVDAFVDAYFANQLDGSVSFIQAIIDFAAEQRQVRLPMDAFDSSLWPEYLNMNYKLIDEHGRQLDMSRNLSELRERYGRKAQADTINNPYDGQFFTDWIFADLPKVLEITTTAKRKKNMFVGLVDGQTQVTIELFDVEKEAFEAHQAGTLRLLQLKLKEQARYFGKELSRHHQLYAHFLTIASGKVFEERFLHSVFERCFLTGSSLYRQADFEKTVTENRSSLASIANETIVLLTQILSRYHQILNQLKKMTDLGWLKDDVEDQLEELIDDTFWAHIDWKHLSQYPRYLDAILMRFDKAREDITRDKQQTQELMRLLKRYDSRVEKDYPEEREPLAAIFWQIQELRVSLFAQSLKTQYPVSVKRIEKALDGFSHR